MQLMPAITGAASEGHAIIGFDRKAREYLIGPMEAKGRSFLAGCLFKKDEPGHDHANTQPARRSPSTATAIRTPSSGSRLLIIVARTGEI
jgi:hypothetical protein